MPDSDSFHSHVTKKEYRLTFRLIVIRRLLCTCFPVSYMVFNMWLVLARLLGLGLITIRLAIVSLCQGLQFPR